MFPDSSVVEHSTVNRMAVGSNPTRGAIFHLVFFRNFTETATERKSAGRCGRTISVQISLLFPDERYKTYSVLKRKSDRWRAGARPGTAVATLTGGHGSDRTEDGDIGVHGAVITDSGGCRTAVFDLRSRTVAPVATVVLAIRCYGTRTKTRSHQG